MSTINRRSFLQCGAALSAEGALRSPNHRKPNILFIMADEFRLDCLGANGNRNIQTPNLDKLASGGANFSNFFVQAPVCVPSRISYFTGRYPHSHKNRVNYTPCDTREVMLQRILKEAGYRTGSVGKLHFYPPTAEHAGTTGFDEVYLDDGIPATDPYSDYVRWRKAHDPNPEPNYLATAKDIKLGKNPFRGIIAQEFTPTFWTGMQTVRLLREFCASPQPFFLFSSFFKPHMPFTVPVPFDTMYDAVEIPLPKIDTLEDVRKLPLPVQKQIEQQRAYEIDPRRLQWIYRSYYASISMVDHQVGLILDELERSGRANNTIVVFTTDHGDQMAEHGSIGKNVFFESSVHIPLILRFPARTVSSKHHQLIEQIDLLPTILDLCGLPTPSNVQGRSFVPLMTGGGGSYVPRDMVFAENVIPSVVGTLASVGTPSYHPYTPGMGVDGILHPDAKMARTARWKLNYYPTCDGELYDLLNDPGETQNLWSDPASAGIVRELKDAILNWMITADERDQIAPHWLV
jgi:arylsulfatase A-like enzyme